MPFEDIVKDFPFLKYFGQYYVITALSFSLFCIFIEIVGYQFMKPVMKRDYLTDKFGIFWKTDKTIPYHKLTDAEVKQGPVGRIFGFADIHLQTAGSSGTEAVLVGIKDYVEAQKEIRDRIRQSRNGDALVEKKDVMQQILEVLQEINSKLK
jgi:membrane protein YdbS with pleckstrin-like domain